jgi:hypothetical protein
MKKYAVFLFMLALSVLSLSAQSSESTMRVSFSGPVEMPGVVLPAGTYMFVLPSEATSSYLQVFNADRTHLIRTFEIIDAQRAKATDGIEVDLAEQPSAPPALKALYAPGETIGFELLYPGAEEKQIAHDSVDMIDAGNQRVSGD